MTPYKIPQLSKRELARMLKAAELIETGERIHSCAAIEEYRNGPFENLADAYGMFFEQDHNDTWDLGFNYDIGRPLQELRVLLLLMFWAAGGGEPKTKRPLRIRARK